MIARWLAHRSSPGAIVSHFQRELSPRGERRLRTHLQECGACRALYDLQLLLESGGGAARARRDRLEAALFAPKESSRRSALRLGIGLAGAAAALLLAVISLRGAPAPEYREKGLASSALLAASRRVSVSLYAREAAQRVLVPASGEVASGQPLAFAYSNEAPEGFDRLLLFALDESATVYWFYPAWTDPRSPPSGGYPIRSGADLELPDQIAHQYQGSRLWIVALFTARRDLGVREVEAAAEGLRRRGAPLDRLEQFPLAETGQHILSLRVRRP